MDILMEEERFSIISEDDKQFIKEFDKQIGLLGYDCGRTIGSGYCWGRYMIIYSKSGAKTKKVIARIYIRENNIVLRLFFNNINKHSDYIRQAPTHIKDVFINDRGLCGHCEGKKDKCNFRKTYVIDGDEIQKCSGVTFEFFNPTISNLKDYIELLKEFYGKKLAVGNK